jgi:PIN domain nuclease of toxin-antitoxin system
MPDWSQGAKASLLLDTHVWLWHQAGDPKLGRSKGGKECIRLQSRGGAYVSVISVWEVAMLAAKGRVKLTLPCETWIDQALTAPGMLLQGLTPNIAVRSVALGDTLHPDPADRFLIATALELGVTLVTADERILAFGRKEKRLKTLAV